MQTMQDGPSRTKSTNVYEELKVLYACSMLYAIADGTRKIFAEPLLYVCMKYWYNIHKCMILQAVYIF